MKLHQWPNGICFYLVCICMFWWISCATTQHRIQTSADSSHDNQSVIPPAAKETQSASILDTMRIETKGNTCTLVFETNGQPNYTIFKLSNPERIIVDLLDVAGDKTPKGKEINNEFIAGIKINPIREKDKDFQRIEIATKKPVAYSANSRGTSLAITLVDKNDGTVTQEKAVTSPQDQRTISARKENQPEGIHLTPGVGDLMSIRDITCTIDGSVHKISIVSDKDIKNYKAYLLMHPLRLVVDLPMTRTEGIKPIVSINSECVSAIRVGQNNKDGRVVVDLKGDVPPYYQVGQEKNALYISINRNGKMLAGKRAEKQLVPQQAEVQQEAGTKQETEQPPAPQQEPKQYTGEKISFDFKDADIKNVLRLIADISGMNIIVGERVTGKVTLKLENIAWDEALDIILENNGLGKIESKNIVRIDTAEQIKKINEEKLLAKKSHEQVQDTIVKTIDISYAKASDLAAFIKNMNILTPNRGSVTPFELTNKLTINDIPSVVEKVEEIVKQQDIPTRQVMIEARVVQTSPNYVKEMGIRWGGEYRGHQSGGRAEGGADIPISGTLGPEGNSVVDLLTAGNIGIGFGYIKDRYNLDVKLSALENEDKLKILSNPKILSLDNKESEIKQGVALPYLKLNENGVSSTEFKEAVLEMKVRPKITSANTIALHINVKKDQKSAQTGVNNEPGIDVREIKTDLLVASGKTIVIGGIYENTVSTNIKKVPYLGDIPFLGRAFRSEKHEDQLTELLVFLTVTIVPSPETVAEFVDKTN